MKLTPEQGMQKAKELGHDLKSDPLLLSSIDRHTCIACGRAVLMNSELAYGSATTTSCADAQKENKR